MLDRVLVPLDGSRLAECTVPHAVALARTFKSRITFVRVLEPDKNGADSVPMSPASWALRRAEAKRRVEEFVDRLRGIGVRTKGVVLEGGGIVKSCGSMPRWRRTPMGHP